MGEALDTRTDARDRQVVAWAAMSDSEKLQLVDDLCRAVDDLARAGIGRDHPDATGADVLWHLAARRYGTGLADAAFARPDQASSVR